MRFKPDRENTSAVERTQFVAPAQMRDAPGGDMTLEELEAELARRRAAQGGVDAASHGSGAPQAPSSPVLDPKAVRRSRGLVEALVQDPSLSSRPLSPTPWSGQFEGEGSEGLTDEELAWADRQIPGSGDQLADRAERFAAFTSPGGKLSPPRQGVGVLSGGREFIAGPQQLANTRQEARFLRTLGDARRTRMKYRGDR